MPVSGTIAEGWIKIALKGVEAAKAKLEDLKASSKKIGEGLSNIGSASARGFAVATGSILGFLRAADPVRFAIFQAKLEILAIHIGRIFIPILIKAIGVVDKLITYFRNLSNGQRENLLGWTKIGLAILAAGTALNFVIGVVTKVIGLFSSLWSIISGAWGVIGPLVRALMKLLPVGKIIAVLTAAFLMFRNEGGKLAEIGGKLSAIFQRFGQAAAPVFERLKTIGAKLWEILVRVAEAVGKVVDKIFSVLGETFLDEVGKTLPLILQIMPLIEAGCNMVAAALDKVAEVLDKVIGYIKDAEALWNLFSNMNVADIPGNLARGVTGAVINDTESVVGDVLDFVGLPGRETVHQIAEGARDLFGTRPMDDAFNQERARLDQEEADRRSGAGDWSHGSGSAGGLEPSPTRTPGTRMPTGPAVWTRPTPAPAPTPAPFEGDFPTDSTPARPSWLELLAPRLAEAFGGAVESATGEPSTPTTRATPEGLTGNNSASRRRNPIGDYGTTAAGADGGAGNAAVDAVRSMLPEWARGAGTDGASADGSIEGEGGNNFNPLMKPQKVEYMGVEEAFKRANQGAVITPEKLAEQERMRLMRDQLSATQEVARNTTPEPAAVGMF